MTTSTATSTITTGDDDDDHHHVAMDVDNVVDGETVDNDNINNNNNSKNGNGMNMMILRRQQQHPYRIGQYVSVMSRTSPGINQPGGVGRIIHIITDMSSSSSSSSSSSNDCNTTTPTGSNSISSPRNNDTTMPSETIRLTVKYVLDGRQEKNIALIYVQPYTDLDDDDDDENDQGEPVDIEQYKEMPLPQSTLDTTTTTTSTTNPKLAPGLSKHPPPLPPTRRRIRTKLRDRSLLLGRCNYCGSLRTDCQSMCVFSGSSSIQQLHHLPYHNNNDHHHRHRRRHSWYHGTNHSTTTGSITRRTHHHDENDDDDDDDSNEDTSDSSTTTSRTKRHHSRDSSNSSSRSNSDSSDEQRYETMIQQHRKEYLRYKRSLQAPSSKVGVHSLPSTTTTRTTTKGDNATNRTAATTTIKAQIQAKSSWYDRNPIKRTIKNKLQHRMITTDSLALVLDTENNDPAVMDQVVNQDGSSNNTKNKDDDNDHNDDCVEDQREPTSDDQWHHQDQDTNEEDMSTTSTNSGKPNDSHSCHEEDWQMMDDNDDDDGDDDRSTNGNGHHHPSHWKSNKVGRTTHKRYDRLLNSLLQNPSSHATTTKTTRLNHNVPLGGDDTLTMENDNPKRHHHFNAPTPTTSFIQPEGDVSERLPNDLFDRTQSLSYPQLVSLFDDTIHRMTTIDIPQAKQQLLQYEREYQSQISSDPTTKHHTMVDTTICHDHDDNNNNRSKEMTISRNNTDRRTRLESMLQKCNSLHDELIQRLVRDGYDQCQLAYRKLVSKKFYKSYRASYRNRHMTMDDDDNEPSLPLLPFIGQNMDDTREFTLDAINQTLEDILMKFRWYSKSLRSCLNDNDDDDVSMSNSNEHRNDTPLNEGEGYSSDDTDMSFHEQLLASTNSQTYTGWSKSHFGAGMHPYASKKRRTKIMITSKGKRKKQRTATVGTSTRIIDEVNRIRRKEKSPSTESDSNRTDGGGGDDDDDDESVDIIYENEINQARRHSRKKPKHHRYPRRKGDARIVGDGTSIDDPNNVTFHEQDDNENDYDSQMVPPLSPIPDIEHILRPKNSIVTAQDRNHAVTQTGMAKEQRVSDRMTKWLQANDRNITNLDECENDDPQQLEPLTSRHPRRRRSAFPTENRQDLPSNNDNTAQSIIPSTTIDETKTFLYSKLLKRQPKINQTTLPDCARPSSLMSVCGQMKSLRHDSALRQALDELCAWFDHANIDNESDASLAFQTLLDLLRNDGTRSLQDLVSDENPALDRFISVLVSIFGLFRRRIHHRLTFDDGVLFAIFGKDRCHIFVEFCVLQLVDTIMSLFHPLAWALQIRDIRIVLDKLEPLRNELALHMHLIERVCDLLLRKLPLQEWRCVRDGENVFVSSINPDDWTALLTSGVQPQWTTSVRFTAFANVLPRCEVDAIWCSLAFFSGTSIETQMSDNGTSRWCLLSELLFKGSLSTSENATPIPPEAEQVKAAIDDVRNIIYLIMSGAVGTLPKRDNLLVDVMQKALLLEADYILTNESLHESPQFTIHKKKGRDMIAFIRGDIVIDTSMTFEDAFNSFISDLCSTNVSDTATTLPFLLPSSPLLRNCLALLLVWKRQIPLDKMKRLQCLGNAVKSFAKQIIGECEILDDQTQERGEEAVQDAFSAAFNAPTKEPIFTTTAARKVSYLKESTAYIIIFESASCDCDNNTWNKIQLKDGETGTQKVVWDHLSSDAMKLRQYEVVTNNLDVPQSPNYSVETLSLDIAARAMSFIGILVINKIASNCIVNASMTTDECAAIITESFSSIKNVMSCLVACIQVACNVESGSDIVSNISMYAAFLLKSLDNARQHCNCISSEFDKVMHSLVAMILETNVIQCGFYKVLGSLTSDNEGDILLQYIVSFIYISTKLFLSDRAVATSVHSAEETTSYSDFDAFDNIDDDVLANIDIGLQGHQSNKAQDANEIIYIVCNMLVNALESSRPSNRTSLASHEVGQISLYGMKLIGKHFRDLCKIIADITSVHWCPQCPIKMTWNNVFQWHDIDDHDNVKYFKDINQAINSDLCKRHNLVVVQKIIRGNVEPFIFSCLEAMMSLKLLRKLPSCNLHRIGKEGATAEEERAFSELVDFRNGCLFRLNEGLTDMRDYCTNLGRILLTKVDGQEISHFNYTVGKLLDVFSNDTRNTKFVPSLERECFQRFILFRSLISATTMSEYDENMFERISTFILLICTTAVVQALQKIVILDQALLHVKGHMYARSKLFETVACLIELHVNIVSEILWCHYKKPCATASQNFDSLIVYIRDGFISPLLGGKDKNPLACLRNLARHSVSFLNGQKPMAGRVNGNVTSNFDMQAYCKLYQNSFVRRCRELIVSTSVKNCGSAAFVPSVSLLGLLHTTMIAGNDDTTIVGQAFSSSSFYRKANYLHLINNKCRSPFEIAIDDYYITKEGSEDLTTAQKNNLHDLKVHALSAVALPMLAGEYKQPIYVVSKTCLLRFIISIFTVWQEENDSNRMIEILLICVVIKQIGVALRNEVLYSTTNTVNDSLLELLFLCGRSVLTLPANLVDTKAVGWVVDWVCPSKTSTNNIHCNYVWYVCGWIRTLGNMLLQQQQQQRTGHIESIRRGLMQHATKISDSSSMDAPVWIPLGESDEDLERARYLNEMEETVFTRPQQPKYLKANRYVTGRTQKRQVPVDRESQSLTEQKELWLVNGNDKIVAWDGWVLSDNLRMAILHFNETIRFATPSRNDSLPNSVES